jgi:diguanylate cyclase (GGDEF)-like protein/PAS domain S-box-containing protein
VAHRRAAAAWPGRQVLLVYALIALLGAAIGLGAWSQRLRIPLLSSLDGQVLDWQLRQRGVLAPASPVPIEILMRDERSAAELGSAAHDRRTLASAIDRLAADGAAWIGVDLLLSEAQNADDDRALATAIARAGQVVLPFALPSAVPAAAAASAPAAAPAVAPKVLATAYRRYRNDALAARIGLQAGALLAPIPPLLEAARGLGHVSVQTSLDNLLRHDLPAVPFDGEFYPSMAVTLAALASGVAPTELEFWVAEAVLIGPKRVPLDETSQQWVNYLGPRGSFPTRSLSDLVKGRLPPGTFRGRIVLIGGDALGTSDRYGSPFDAQLPGVERVATVLDNLMSGQWLARPYWVAPAEAAAVFVLPWLVVFGFARYRALPMLASVLLLAVAGLVLSQALLQTQRLVVSPLYPLLAVLLSAGLALAYRSLLYERARRTAEQQLRASEERFALAARGANDGLWDWDLVAGHTYWSPRARQMLGPADDDAPNSPEAWARQLPAVEGERFLQELRAHLDGRSQQLHHELRHQRDGESRWLLVRGVAVREAGRAVRMAGSLTDITEPKRLEGQIAFDAMHDRLTGLANRELFTERLGQWLRAPLRPTGDAAAPAAAHELGLALLDIDGFRQINEVHGHLTGNQVLVEAGSRLRQLVEARPEGGLLARVGPDQFAFAVQGSLEVLEETARVAREVLAAPMTALLQAPEGAAHPADAQGLSVTVAMAHTEHQLDGVDELLNGAMLALAQAKRQARGGMRSFDPAEQALQNSRRWLDEHIDRALVAGGQFRLYYQPFVRLSDRVLIGFEALIRWQHPERGMVMPNDFIPHAEQTGQINAIGRWTLFEAARQLVAWEALGFRGEIAVNLSGRQFTETDLEADARQVLEVLGSIEPRRYKLEVTESMAMENPQRTAKVLTRLADLGFKISIDDFGTGYSSLAYLHRFPFDTLKIDRSFVIRLNTGREAQEIVRTIVGLGAALDKQVLAEGVEDEAQAQQLLALGVHVGQGWLFAKAMSAEAATKLIGASAP